MTLVSKTGIENVCDTCIQIFRDKMPAKIATFNSENSAYIRAHFSGSYTFASDSTVILTKDNGSAETYTIPAGTYTAAQIVTTLTGLSGFSTNWEAATIMAGNYFEIRVKDKGLNGSIQLGEGTANSTFGFISNSAHNFYALQDIVVWRAQTRILDTTLEAYPALTLWAEVTEGDKSTEVIPYNLYARLYVSQFQPQLTPQKEAMYTQLMRYFDLMRDVFYGRDLNAIWNTSVNARRITSVRPGEEVLPIDQNRLHWLMWLEINMQINVQELWQQ